MPPLTTTEAAAGGPQLRTWRTTTAVRVFALALTTGAAISESALAPSFPVLVVLATVAAASSLLEWLTRNRPTPWHVVGEALAVSTLIVATGPNPYLDPYLAVPAVAAGIRHGLVTTLNVSFLSVITVVATLALDPGDDVMSRATGALPWLAIGLGVGLLTSWQSRSTRDLAARQAPYAAAHQLMARLHQMASSGFLGLDSTSLAAELQTAMRTATGAARTSLFVLDDGEHRALLNDPDVERLRAEIDRPAGDRTPGAAVIPLRGADRLLGHAVLVGVPRWTPELDAVALEIADDFAVRLDTAVLFDQIRHLAAAEERNRIARDMHDGVAQEIVALGYIVDEIESISQETETRQLASTLRDEITRVVSELRYSILDLRHHVTERDLASALTTYAHEVGRDADLRVQLVLDNSAADLPVRVQDELMRIAQEAIGNVRRHARASHLWVTLVTDDGLVRLEVVDDGVGDAGPRDRHWGLQTMHERASGIGAHLTIQDRPGGGTVVRLLARPAIPTQRENAHDHHGPAHR